MKILFVCRGNVARSQIAEALFLKFSKKRHDINSAGTKVVSKEGEIRHGQVLKDLPAAENVILALKEKGIEVAENTRTQLDLDMVDWADKVIVMAEPENIPEYLRNSPKFVYWEIVDPKGTSLDFHKTVIEQIEERVKSFIQENDL